MYVRLGFSIAAHLEPDILLVDEVLAVGDAAFQEQCLGRIRALRRSGTTAILISHDLNAVEQLCDRVMLLERGQATECGGPEAVVKSYRHRLDANRQPQVPGIRAAAPTIALTGVELLDRNGQPNSTCRTGDPLGVRVAYQAAASTAGQAVEVFFYSADGRVLHCQLTTAFGPVAFTVQPGRGTIEFAIDELSLQPGDYAVIASTRDLASQQVGPSTEAVRLNVRPGRMVRGHFYLPHAWQFGREQELR
jgi:ABC-type glutathione transport system ATPase component